MLTLHPAGSALPGASTASHARIVPCVTDRFSKWSDVPDWPNQLVIAPGTWLVVHPGVCAFKSKAPQATRANNDPILILLNTLLNLMLCENNNVKNMPNGISLQVPEAAN